MTCSPGWSSEPIAARPVGSSSGSGSGASGVPAVAGLSAAIVLVVLGWGRGGNRGPVASQPRSQGEECPIDRGQRSRGSGQYGAGEANERVQARFELARQAISAFQQGVNEDDMLKGKELEGLRQQAGGRRLNSTEAGEAAEESDRPFVACRAGTMYYELGELTSKMGDHSAAHWGASPGRARQGAGYSTRFRSIGANRSGTQPDRGRHTNAGDRQRPTRSQPWRSRGNLMETLATGAGAACRGPRNPGR